MNPPAILPAAITSTVPNAQQQAQEILEMLRAKPDGLTLVQIALAYPSDIGAIPLLNRLHWLINQELVERVAQPFDAYLYRVKQ